MGVKVKVQLTMDTPGTAPGETVKTVVTWAATSEDLGTKEVAGLIRNAVLEIDPQGSLELGGIDDDGEYSPEPDGAA